MLLSSDYDKYSIFVFSNRYPTLNEIFLFQCLKLFRYQKFSLSGKYLFFSLSAMWPNRINQSRWSMTWNFRKKFRPQFPELSFSPNYFHEFDCFFQKKSRNLAKTFEKLAKKENNCEKRANSAQNNFVLRRTFSIFRYFFFVLMKCSHKKCSHKNVLIKNVLL